MMPLCGWNLSAYDAFMYSLETTVAELGEHLSSYLVFMCFQLWLLLIKWFIDTPLSPSLCCSLKTSPPKARENVNIKQTVNRLHVFMAIAISFPFFILSHLLKNTKQQHIYTELGLTKQLQDLSTGSKHALIASIDIKRWNPCFAFRHIFTRNVRSMYSLKEFVVITKPKSVIVCCAISLVL